MALAKVFADAAEKAISSLIKLYLLVPSSMISVLSNQTYKQGTQNNVLGYCGCCYGYILTNNHVVDDMDGIRVAHG